jgi:hypothetical protein
MSNRSKKILGVLTLVPALSPVLFAAFWAFVVLSILFREHDKDRDFRVFATVFTVAIILNVWVLVLLPILHCPPDQHSHGCR